MATVRSAGALVGALRDKFVPGASHDAPGTSSSDGDGRVPVAGGQLVPAGLDVLLPA
jgi:hypothetical protein